MQAEGCCQGNPNLYFNVGNVDCKSERSEPHQGAETDNKIENCKAWSAVGWNIKLQIKFLLPMNFSTYKASKEDAWCTECLLNLSFHPSLQLAQ